MLRSAGVFAGVPVLRAVTANGHATCLARAQMHPTAADLHAFFAFTALRLFDRLNRLEMRAATVGHDSISLFRVATTRNVLRHSEIA